MGMKEKIQKIIQDILKVLSEEEKTELLKWAEECQAILKTALSKKEKFSKVLKITSEHKTIQNVFNLLWRNMKKKLWEEDKRFIVRAAVIGGAIGIAFGGLGGAGIAALGGAIGIPFFLVTAAGGAFIGMIIKELKKQQSERS